MAKPQSGLSFKLMSLGFKIRDIVRPRGNVLKEVGIRPGFGVLDFGCGPGGYILPLIKLVGEPGKVFAMDMNPAAVLTVKSLALKHKLENVETILAESKTGLPDGIMDVVLLYDVLHHLKKPDDVLQELRRVLKPDGILSVTDHHMKSGEIIDTITGGGLFRLSGQGKVFNFSAV